MPAHHLNEAGMLLYRIPTCDKMAAKNVFRKEEPN